jgi:alkylated DNA nucleotide flippase Atl1/predicted DNA-binding protein (MmcQ/YjbR family)
MDGDFTAEIRVYENGNVLGRVMDNMTDEEYTPLRLPNYSGAFVGSVRAAYEELLTDIADKCCTDVAFVSDQSNRIAALILDKYAVEPDFPWDEGEHEPSGVFRHGSNNKWFGLIMNIDWRHLDSSAGDERVDVINLKADENKTAFLHKIRGIYPAYHMNHRKWISVTLDDTLDDRDVMDLVDESFRLTDSPAGVLNERLIREALQIADSIPPGKVMSYGQIAALMGRPKNARLVGKIMSMQDRFGNHPCHRVVNSAGRTVPGWTEQRELLEAEGVEFRANGNVDMSRFRME